ncbi:hypothetical protein [Metaplanococcus flavidus]|uniref:Uncharacterized protein n=1 Tax=Metaplanococcus flavidus TaxID=569883 RepID=A0ABW3L632_9BACL
MLKKSLLAVLFSMVFALVLGTSGAFAAEATISEDVEKALEEVEKTNAKIYEEIEKAQEKSHELYDKKLEDLGKETEAKKLAEIEEKYEEEIVKLISDLDEKTQQMTRDGVEKAAEAGVHVEIEWILVQFADRQAWIDPIKVIGW